MHDLEIAEQQTAMLKQQHSTLYFMEVNRFGVTLEVLCVLIL